MYNILLKSIDVIYHILKFYITLFLDQTIKLSNFPANAYSILNTKHFSNSLLCLEHLDLDTYFFHSKSKPVDYVLSVKKM